MVWKDEMLCLLSVLAALFITPDPFAAPQAIAGFSYKRREGSGLDPQIPYQAYKAIDIWHHFHLLETFPGPFTHLLNFMRPNQSGKLLGWSR